MSSESKVMETSSEIAWRSHKRNALLWKKLNILITQSSMWYVSTICDFFFQLVTRDYSPSSSSRLIWASVVVSVVAPPNVIKVVHRAGACTISHVPSTTSWVVIPMAALLRNAADGAHSFITVIDCGQRWRLGTTPAASRLQAIMKGSYFTHIVHWGRKTQKRW